MNKSVVKTIVFSITLVIQVILGILFIKELLVLRNCIALDPYNLQWVSECIKTHLVKALVYLSIVIVLCTVYEYIW